jgi:hypothetical protein
MSFICPILQHKRYGLDSIRVDVEITVISHSAEFRYYFVYDTGCEITMVSEDVAVRLGLPRGGKIVKIKGSTGTVKGRLVDVRFRFPKTFNGDPGLECDSTWVVITGMKGIALLGFQEVHRHFSIRALEFDMYFILWSTLRGN